MAETKNAAATAPKVEPAKLGEDFVPNEPTEGQKSGRNEKNEPDGSLGDQQAARAATEALLSLRPQPSADEIQKVLANLAEVDPKTKQPKHKHKTAADAGNAAVAELNKLRGA